MKVNRIAVMFAILAAALYAINIPLCKIILSHIAPTMLAAFLYIGAGVGLLLWHTFHKESSGTPPIGKSDMPYVIGMVVLDIAAPILLMFGLKFTSASNASLINNFEIVATSAIAFFLFGEALSKRLVISIALVTVASIVLGFDGAESLQFNTGSAFVLAAACCWGLENNCTKMLSSKSSVQITTIKGIFSGLGSLITALILGERLPHIIWILAALVLGFVSYGLSINFYIKAQKDLGAAKTGAYYSIAPFLGVIMGIVFLGERPTVGFFIGLVLMAAATWLMIRDTVTLQHTHKHEHNHNHEHSHDGVCHAHLHSHLHSHIHTHGSDDSDHSHNHALIECHNHAH
ncbi:MAG: DMT family transporter [Oscillospiraceae bacterium]|nr:DMT family transporter [Oscillospiraceae bacterium]